MKFLIAVVTLVLATRSYAADGPPVPADPERLVQVREEIRARLMLHRHQKGEVTLSPEELQRFQQVVAAGRERRMKEKSDGQAQRPRSPYVFRAKDMPLAEFARMLQHLYKVPVSVPAELAKKRVSVAISADTLDESVTQLEADLAETGFELVPEDDRLTIQARVSPDQKGEHDI